MNRSDSIAQLADSLSKAQGEIRGATKDADNPFYKSKYADLESVWGVAREPLAKHGLSVVQIPSISDGYVEVETMLLHSSGEWISGILALKPVKDDPQAVGSAISYARRYALAATLGIYQADDDGNAASGVSGDRSFQKKEPSAQEKNTQLQKEAAESVGVKPPTGPEDVQRAVDEVAAKKLEELRAKVTKKPLPPKPEPKAAPAPPPAEPNKAEVPKPNQNASLFEPFLKPIREKTGLTNSPLALHICETLGKTVEGNDPRVAADLLKTTPNKDVETVLSATLRFVTQNSRENSRAVILHEDANLWVEFMKMYSETQVSNSGQKE